MCITFLNSFFLYFLFSLFPPPLSFDPFGFCKRSISVSYYLSSILLFNYLCFGFLCKRNHVKFKLVCLISINIMISRSEPRASCMLNKCPATGLPVHPWVLNFKMLSMRYLRMNELSICGGQENVIASFITRMT